MGAMTLTDFLLARIAEDEDAVTARTRSGASASTDLVEHFVDQDEDERWILEISASRVLAECAAKRQIVDQHLEHEALVMVHDTRRWDDGMSEKDRLDWRRAVARRSATSHVLEALALPYAEHPDYLPPCEWPDNAAPSRPQPT